MAGGNTLRNHVPSARGARASAGRVTGRDVARHAGVAQSTVSRTLRHDPRISDETRLLVEAAARAVGYPANQPKRASRRATRTVGVVIADLGNPYYVYLLDQMQREFSAHGYHVLLILDPINIPDDLRLYSPLLERSVDGLIITTAIATSRGPELLTERGIPVVLAIRATDRATVDMVVSDNVMGGEEAGRHIAALGHRRIALVLGPDDTSTSRDRELGIRRVLEERDLAIRPEYRRAGSYSYESGYARTMDLLSATNPPTAIICGNDVIALGALEAARKRRVNVPGQLSIIGFDDMPMASWESFRLTTVRQASPEIGQAAARRLLERIGAASSMAPRIDVFPMSLVVRDTTGPPPRGRP